MAHSSRSIGHLLAYSMLPIWAGAVLLLLVVIALVQVPVAERVEEQRMKEHLQRVFRAMQADVRSINAFTRDWGMWDETHAFIARPNRSYIDSNLLVDTPMRDFELNLLSYLDLQGYEIWTRTLLPDMDGIDTTLLPHFLDELKLRLLGESHRQGITSLSGVVGSQWGPLIFSLQPVTDSAGKAKPNGFLLVLRWLDRRYMAGLMERTALPLSLILPRSSDRMETFKPLGDLVRYRLVKLGLQRVRGEGLLLDGQGTPILILRVEEEREVLQGAMEGAIWMLVGMLLISLGCILIARQRMRTIVLEPVNELVAALQRFSEKPDVQTLPVIGSSREMALLSRKFREMAAKISLQHSALQAHSSRMELAAYTDPLTLAFNRRYLGEWLLARYELAEPRCLVLLDLDHFKRINDEFGHDTGDLVLRQLADLLRRAVHEGEPLIRLGGEEFLLLLSRQDAAARIEQLRREIAAHRFGQEATPLRMTVSLGYCDYPLHREMEESFWELSFKLADIALYGAKLAGRDRWQGFSGELAREWWTALPEQIVAGKALQWQASDTESDANESASETRERK